QSSASYPTIPIFRIPNAVVTSLAKSNCGRISTGASGRFALYPSYKSFRNVTLPISQQTAVCVGFICSIAVNTCLIYPCTAFVANIVLLIIIDLRTAGAKKELNNYAITRIKDKCSFTVSTRDDMTMSIKTYKNNHERECEHQYIIDTHNER